MPLQEIALGIIAVWLIGLSVGLVLVYRFFDRLSSGVKTGNLKRVLDKILENQTKTGLGLANLEREVKKLEEEGALHVQKVGLVRFNPFRETGGDHSFSLALLNAKNTGIILTSLHTRERTRVYIKAVKKGKSEYEFSQEEKKAQVLLHLRKT